MISEKLKSIFVAIPKTGSVSVESVLKEFDFELVGPDRRHFTYSEHLHTYPKAQNYFSFCFVRNPWDRLVSQYKYTGAYWLKIAAIEDHSFESYIKNLVITGIPFSRHRYPKKADAEWGQLQFIYPGMDFVGKFENLQKDFDVVCDRIGIPLQELPHENKTEHKHYTEYYDDETREIVAEKYAKDIEYFGYDFGE